MRIVVSDSSCLIDLQRANLLEAFLQLPYDLVIPDVLFHNELLSFSKREKALIKKHMTVASLEADGVIRAGAVLASSPTLSTYDCFAFVVAEERPQSILLTGDQDLRSLAEAEGMEVHGVLWAVQQLGVHKRASRKKRLAGLESLRDHPASRLPTTELKRMIGELRGTRRR